MPRTAPPKRRRRTAALLVCATVTQILSRALALALCRSLALSLFAHRLAGRVEAALPLIGAAGCEYGEWGPMLLRLCDNHLRISFPAFLGK